MKKIMLTVAATVAGLPALASTVPGPPSTSVPEISALEGTAALAAVAAIVLLAWERRRRAS